MNLFDQSTFRTSIITAISLMLLAGCSFDGTPLTTSGVDKEPHMVWDGTHFGIVYYHSAQSLGWPSIDVVKVDSDGTVVSSRTGVGSIEHLYTPYLLSDLVWNEDDQQFAFAYTKGKVIHFVRLDASHNVIGSPIVIRFEIDLDSYEHPTLRDMSLVWNNVRQEYGLTFVTREHPYLQAKHDDIYLSRISPGGTFVGQYDKLLLVTCADDCEKTSLTYNTNTGQYAVSYFRNDFPTFHVMLSLLGSNGVLATHELMSDWNPNGWGEETRAIFDARTNEYAVAALKRKSGINGHELCYQLANANGAPVGESYPISGHRGFDNLITMANYLSPATNVYLICAEGQGHIRCWMAGESGHIDGDIVTTPGGANSWGPTLALADGTYLAWIQDGTLNFGVADNQ